MSSLTNPTPGTPAPNLLTKSSSSNSIWLGTPIRTSPRSIDELTGIGLGRVRKTDRESLRQSDKKGYYKVRDNAVEGMSSKFTLLKGIDEKATMEHLELVYSVVTPFEDLRTQIIANDMLDVFQVPSDFTKVADSYLPLRTATQMDLFKDVNKIELETVQHANAFYLEYGQEFHGENVVWSGEKVLNSCVSELHDKLIESTRAWPKKHIGGPTYLKLLLGLILSTSQKSLPFLTDKLQVLRLTDFSGENATKAVSFIQGAALTLTNNDTPPLTSSR